MDRAFRRSVKPASPAGTGAGRAEGKVFLAPSLPWGWIDGPPSLNRLIGLRWLLHDLLSGRGAKQTCAPTRANSTACSIGVTPSDAQTRPTARVAPAADRTPRTVARGACRAARASSSAPCCSRPCSGPIRRKPGEVVSAILRWWQARDAGRHRAVPDPPAARAGGARGRRGAGGGGAELSERCSAIRWCRPISSAFGRRGLRRRARHPAVAAGDRHPVAGLRDRARRPCCWSTASPARCAARTRSSCWCWRASWSVRWRAPASRW